MTEEKKIQDVPDTEAATGLIMKNPDLLRDNEITKGKMDDVFLTVTGKELKFILNQRIVWNMTNLTGTAEDGLRTADAVILGVPPTRDGQTVFAPFYHGILPLELLRQNMQMYNMFKKMMCKIER